MKLRIPNLHAALFLLAAVVPVQGKDHFLVIAGGQEAAKNQVSLEKNVLFFRKVLNEKSANADLTEYFSSGNADIRSVQFASEDYKIPEANLYMARLFGSTYYLDLQYRKHTLGKVDGVTSSAKVNQWFDVRKDEITPGDRVIVYVTAHGGRSNDKTKPENTRVHLWKRQSMDVRSLQTNVRKLAEDVEVVLVMAQCYSGGFSHSIFTETDPKAGEFDRRVCGFFATVSSRESAGCTPDINEENYDEFSSHFWAAIRGRTRTDDPVKGCDLNGDRKISFDEAYAYTILTSKNIDIPMKTSGAFLRARSRYREAENAEENVELLPQHHPYPETLKLAGPVERAILEGLSKQFGLSGDARYEAVEKAAAEIEKRRADLLAKNKEKKRISDDHRNAIRDTLLGFWPDLANLMTPQSVELVSDSSDDFLRAVKAHPFFELWNEVEKERKAIEDERFNLEKEWAQRIRFLRAHNNVVLAENLRRLGNENDLARFEQIREMESGGIGD